MIPIREAWMMISDFRIASEIPIASASMLVAIFFLRTVVYHFTSQVKQQDESDPVVEGCNVFLESDTGQIAQNCHCGLCDTHKRADLNHIAYGAIPDYCSAGYGHGQTIHR